MKIIFTSALIENHQQQRKLEYINSFNVLVKFGQYKNVKILECVNNTGESYLNELTNNIFYTKKNYTFNNKGVNEILNIHNFFENEKIDDNELILKVTGRYQFLDDSFINECENSEYDIILKRDDYNQVFFGSICAKKYIWYDFIKSTNWLEIENKMECIEKTFSDYIENRHFKVKTVNKINIKCNINNNDLHII